MWEVGKDEKILQHDPGKFSRKARKRQERMTAPWALDLQRQELALFPYNSGPWHSPESWRPRCALCGGPILEDEALVLDGKFYCLPCVSWNTEEVTEFDPGLEGYSLGL